MDAFAKFWWNLRQGLIEAKRALPEAPPPAVYKGGIAKDDVIRYLESLALEEETEIDKAVSSWLRTRRWPARIRNLPRFLIHERLSFAIEASGWALTSRDDFQTQGAADPEALNHNVIQWLLTTYWELHGPSVWAREFYEHGCYDYEK